METGCTAQGPYIAIDLKSYYASVECVERGLDPLTTNLVVADNTRTDKTICLAVSPSLKAKGVPGRPRLFEVNQILLDHRLRTGETVRYITAMPRMAKYIEVSARIYSIYLNYVSPEDIHVYSIDEVFIDARPYLKLYRMSAHELALTMVRDVLNQTGITATAGIGTNLYLAKIAMDIVAKKMPADRDGVRIAELDEEGYRRQLWSHLPLKDFWQVADGTTRRLQSVGIHTMGDLARCSMAGPGDYPNEDTLFRLFGIDAEILIDHAWGLESCTMADIKRYRTSSKSMSIGQVLARNYRYEETRIIVREMLEQLVYDLVDKAVLTDGIVLHIGYDYSNVRGGYRGESRVDMYGRTYPRSAHGTAKLGTLTSSLSAITEAVMVLFDRIVDPSLSVRRVNLAAIRVVREEDAAPQLDLFTDYETKEREKHLQKAIIGLQKRYGKNVLLKGHDFLEGATTRERNGQIGGHRASYGQL